MKKNGSLFFCFFLSLSLLAQIDPYRYGSCRFRVSLLTCTPGTELYSTFGHSALRIVDSISGTDIIYNYGTFDFEDPHFYTKFIRGKLLYFVSVDEFTNFMYQYQYEKRGITEQVLSLSCAEKQKLVTALEENAREENKYYKYDFVYDNCTTRLRDLVAAATADTDLTKNIIPPGTSFRNLIHEYLNKSGQYWSKLGIDMLMGTPVDKKISNKEAMFLPDYLLKGFDSTTIGQRNLVLEKKTILAPSFEVNNKMFFTPLVVFSILFLLVTILSFTSGRKAGKSFLNIFDKAFFLLCGLLGLLILFMWFGTDHLACSNNFNLAWALPTHLFIAPFIHQQKTWIKIYFQIIFWLTLFLVVAWFFLPQQMNNAFLPITGIILVRSFFTSKKS